MNALWWLLWGIELFAAVLLLVVTAVTTRTLAIARDLRTAASDVRSQAEFWRQRCGVLDERLRHYARKRDGKGRFSGKVG